MRVELVTSGLLLESCIEKVTTSMQLKRHRSTVESDSSDIFDSSSSVKELLDSLHNTNTCHTHYAVHILFLMLILLLLKLTISSLPSLFSLRSPSLFSFSSLISPYTLSPPHHLSPLSRPTLSLLSLLSPLPSLLYPEPEEEVILRRLELPSPEHRPRPDQR